MPLYELYRLAREKLGDEMNDTIAPDQTSSPKNDFFELVWEGGQISSQDQSSRARKSPPGRGVPSHCLPSHSPKARDKDVGVGYGIDTGLNGIPMSAVPSQEGDLRQDEDIIPWLDYTMDGSLQHEYDSNFFHELSGVTENDLPASNNFFTLDKRSKSKLIFRDSHKNPMELMNLSKGSPAEQLETAIPKASTNQLYSPPRNQCQPPLVPVRSRALDMPENDNANQDVPYGEITHIPSPLSDFSSLKVQKQDQIMPSNASTTMNFSHFARPVATVRANLQNVSSKSRLSSAKPPDKMGIKNKGAASTSINPPESNLVDSSGECLKEPNLHCMQVVDQSKADFKPLRPKSLEQNTVDSKQLEPACKESSIKLGQTSNQIPCDGGAKGQATAEKSMELAVPSSSVCSGNGIDRGSDDPNQSLKRKSRDTEESECHSEDVEEESVGGKKAAAGRGVVGSKRSRAAEVHNLSERRRRDRINEKMRALQELIPNCNKVDKASMLDEAIEYLKTLQLQVQMMSMGAGLYMSPMMLPVAMQHMHAPHMAAFSPLGVGMHMGLGMGYGMGTPDMNVGSSRFPMIQVPQMQGTHVPVAHMSGPSALHGVVRSNPAGFGFPGQGLSTPMPRAPVFPFSGGTLMNSSAMDLNACGSAVPVDTVDSASASGLKDPMPNIDLQINQSTGGRDSTSQMPNQCEATAVGFEQSGLVHNSGHASVANDSGAANPSNITL